MSLHAHLNATGCRRLHRPIALKEPNFRLRTCCRPVAVRARADGNEQASSQQAGREQQEPGPLGQGYQGQNYYQQVPAYQQPYQYAQRPSSGGGVPWGWMIFGAILAIVFTKVYDFFSPAGGGPQAKVMRFMMNQAMKGQGGMGSPAGNAGSSPMAGFPDFSSLSQSPGFPGGAGAAKPKSPVFDAQARSVEEPAGATAQASAVAPAEPSIGSGSTPGAKFEEMKAQGRRRRREKDGTRAAFTDVDETAQPSTAAGQPAAESTNGSTAAADQTEDEALDKLFRDPAIQEMLYQHLPETMRNKETFEWMLNNPEYRKQLQDVLKKQDINLDPEVFKQFKDLNQQDVTDQLAQFGMTPEDVLQKIMADPELARAFTNPTVQQAIMEAQSNPAAIAKYMDNPDIMMVFEKMSQMFPQAANPGS